MEYQFRTDSKPKHRYFFILNRNPDADEVLFVPTATTQIAERKRHRPPEVLVALTPTDYASLPEGSLIDCESAMVWPKDAFLTKVSQRRIQPLAPLPDNVMLRLCRAVAHCRTHSPHHKRLVLEEEE